MMNWRKKIALFTSGAAIFLSVCSISEAAKIDAYRDILLSKSYTIKYDNITPPKRQTNKDKAPLFGSSGMAVEKNDYLTNRRRSGLVTSDGLNRYEEVGDSVFSQCRLIKGDEIFNFTKYPKKDNPKELEYMGNKKNKVQAVKRNYLAESLEGESYGDADTSKIINAILPQNNYNFVASGNLPNGLSYEDFKGGAGNVTSVIRYYFNGNDLVKIASAQYYKNPSGNIEGQKYIISIKEFTSTPDTSLLKLPQGLADDTKR